MKIEITEAQFTDAAESVSTDVDMSYSGRNMYGKVCPSFDFEDITDLIRFGAKVQELTGSLRVAEYLTKHGRIDSMGLGYVVYFPNLEFGE